MISFNHNRFVLDYTWRNHLNNKYMYEVKSKMKLGQPFWTVHEGRPFEDMIVKIEITATLNGDIAETKETCFGKELGEVNPEKCYSTKRNLAVGMGWVDPIKRKRSETIEPLAPVVTSEMEPTDEEKIIFPDDVKETIHGKCKKSK